MFERVELSETLVVHLLAGLDFKNGAISACISSCG